MKCLTASYLLNFLILWLIIASHEMPGQTVLIFKKNQRKVAYYRVSETIGFRLKGSKTDYHDTIIGFTDSLILFEGYQIHPKEISHLLLDRQTRQWNVIKYKWSRLLLIGGLGYPLIDLVNHGNLSEKTLVRSGSSVGLGMMAAWVIPPRIKIKGKRRLYIVNH